MNVRTRCINPRFESDSLVSIRCGDAHQCNTIQPCITMHIVHCVALHWAHFNWSCLFVLVSTATTTAAAAAAAFLALLQPSERFISRTSYRWIFFYLSCCCLCIQHTLHLIHFTECVVVVLRELPECTFIFIFKQLVTLPRRQRLIRATIAFAVVALISTVCDFHQCAQERWYIY